MSTIINATTTNGVVIQPDNSGSLVLQTNSGTTALTIDTSQRAAFVAGTAAAPAITTTGDTNTGIWFPAADTIAFAEGGAESMRIDSNGNVGIGTASPAYKLDVSTDIRAGGSVIIGSSGTYVAGSIYSDASWGMIFRAKQASPGAAEFLWTNAADTALLRIETTGTLTSQATYNNTAAGSTVVVTSAGLIRRTSSSLKYKKDVETLEQTIVDNAVNNLRPVWYRTKNADGDDKATWSHIGLIAEEVDLVEPRLVKYKTVEVTQDEKNANVTTELETPVPEDVDYAKLSVILLAKVKQLEARIAVLEAK